jgi:hypothetical protein
MLYDNLNFSLRTTINSKRKIPVGKVEVSVSSVLIECSIATVFIIIFITRRFQKDGRWFAEDLPTLQTVWMVLQSSASRNNG